MHVKQLKKTNKQNKFRSFETVEECRTGRREKKKSISFPNFEKKKRALRETADQGGPLHFAKTGKKKIIRFGEKISVTLLGNVGNHF